jgi:hypothetical protein
MQGDSRMHQDNLYFKERERAERAAAKRALNVQARRVHQELADGYAALARSPAQGVQHDEGSALPHFTIVGE